MLIFHVFQAKNKKVDHIETRNVNKVCELYIELTSNSLSEWPALRNILETLSSIDIHPRNTNEQQNVKKHGKQNPRYSVYIERSRQNAGNTQYF